MIHTNKVIDVWDENGYMMNSCMDYECYREKLEKWTDLFKSLSNVYGSEITLNHNMIKEMNDAINGLVKSSEDAINEKSEIIRTLKDTIAELKKGGKNGSSKEA